MTKKELHKVLEALENSRPFGRNHDEARALVRAYLERPETQDAVHGAMWRAHVGKLDALVSFCPTCCEGKIANADMTRDEVIFQCGIVSGRSADKRAELAKPAAREPQDERAAFEAWHSEYRGLLPLRRDDSYFDTHARLRWEGWQARAHGITGGGNG